jgi:hypothetical protein
MAFSQEVVIQPIADTTLAEAAPNNNLGGNPNVNAGTTQNFTRNRGLFEFDIAGNVPAQATITSVTLTFEVTGQPKDGYNASFFDLNRMLSTWGEGTGMGTTKSPGIGAPATTGEATWNDRFFGLNEPWAAPGGAAGVDYAVTPSTSQVIYNVATSPYTFGSSPGMVADVQLWLNHPDQNNGWMLLTESEANNFTARRFASREDAVRAPFLTIDYQLAAVPEPAVGALFCVGGIGLLLLRRSWE